MHPNFSVRYRETEKKAFRITLSLGYKICACCVIIYVTRRWTQCAITLASVRWFSKRADQVTYPLIVSYHQMNVQQNVFVSLVMKAGVDGVAFGATESHRRNQGLYKIVFMSRY